MNEGNYDNSMMAANKPISKPVDLGPFDAYKQMVDQKTADIDNVLKNIGNRLERFSSHHPVETKPGNEPDPMPHKNDFDAMHYDHHDRLEKLCLTAQHILDGFNL